MQPAREQSIRKKIGSIFSLGNPRSNPTPPKSHEDHVNQEQSPFITEDVLRELDRSLPTQHRVRAMKELHDIVSTKRLEEHAVKSIWLSIQDLIQPSQSTEVRHTTLIFLKALIYGQFDDLGILRTHFFQVVRNHNIPEDTQERFDILRVLTLDGKNILHLEQDVGRFLLEWMPEFVTLGKPVNFVSLLVNFVHYNAAFLDQDVLVGLVQMCCELANKTHLPNVIALCLDFMNAVVCYSSLPVDSLQMFVFTLCSTLNIERFTKKSLDVMLRLLGTHLGRATIYAMCSLIQERSAGHEALLLRGAVFYISMSMWGVRRVNLDLSFASVLPSIKQAVLSGHTIVVYEVSLSLLRLVQAHAPQLHPLEWEAVYDTVAAIQSHMIQLERIDPGGSSKSNLGHCLKDLFMTVEQLYECGANIGSPDLFFGLVERSLDTMPIQSVLSLLSYRTMMAHSTEDGWVDTVRQCLEKFYRCDRRTEVRVEALKYLGRVVEENSLTHERELMKDVVLPLLEPITEDADESVRCQGAQLLVHLLMVTEPEWGTEILSILSSLLQQGMHIATSKAAESPRLSDSKAAVFGLTEAFKSKLQSSSPIAAQIFTLLVSLVLQHYHESCFIPSAGVIRMKIFSCMLSVRCNELSQLGYQEEGVVTFTPFFTCQSPDKTTDHAPTQLEYRSAFNAILVCIKEEREREVLVQVLCDLVPLLQDRHLTLSAMPDLSVLTTHLCDLTSIGVWSRTDVPPHVYPVLAVLATYPSHMDRRAQERLVMSLDAGLVGKGARTCVAGLGLCALEMQTTMRRLLPRVLLKLGQIAATPTLAVPVLEFLSGLVPTSFLHRGFVEQEYLSVFAIALPYTNHQKYSPYVIALAHRVVAQWFVSSRLQYRPTIASFILKYLARDMDYQCVGGEGGGVGVELVEVCRDMLARYTYSNVSALPVRSSGAEFLLDRGPTKTWCVGNSLVTITTSRGSTEQCSCSHSSDQNADSDLHGNKKPCSCLCKGWAEVLIHRPTGNVSWVMKLQNWLVSEKGWGLFNGGRGMSDDGVLALHKPVGHTHGSFEDLTEESNLHLQRDVDGGRDVTPVNDVRGVSPVGDVTGVTSVTPVGDVTGVTSVTDVGGVVDTEALDTEVGNSDVKEAEASTQNEGLSHVGEIPNNENTDVISLGKLLDNEESDCVNSSEKEDTISLERVAGVDEEEPTGDQSPLFPESWPESVASYSNMASLEHLPPLLSYDKDEETGLSPPLTSQQLSEPRQLQLHSDLSSLSSTDSSSFGSGTESGDELSSCQYDPAPQRRPRLKHKSLSLPDESPSSLVADPPPPPTVLTTLTTVTHSPGPQRRKSAPSTPLDRSPQQRKRVLYSHQTTHSPQSGGGGDLNDPSFVFLQLYHSSLSSLDTPLLLPNNEAIERAVKNLHRIHPYETHKIGVLYVARGQTSEREILANSFGSSRYLEFLKGLGSLLRLPDVPPRMVYLGGLDQSGTDGKVTYCYHDTISQVIYHVATLMPTDLTSDPVCSCKKLHIGNDFVTIVYNDSGSEYKFGTLKGQFNFAEVVVEPRPRGVNVVTVCGRSEMRRLVSGDPVFVSDPWLPQLVRQKALQADLASHVVTSETRGSEHYLTNWLGRLRQIRKIRDKCFHDNTTNKGTNHFTDFT